ncbi:hypothetical protein [Streptosporangium sp. NPDC002721]|uniref:hypothetical protein n=1 Tax=Streptosporangium sp. NPDC002721 TaxID=3366188 RepID=UPI0036B2BB7C
MTDRVMFAFPGSPDASVAEAPKHVIGEIRTTPHGGRATVIGRRSEVSLYDFGLAAHDTGETLGRPLAKGFAGPWSLPARIASARDARLS